MPRMRRPCAGSPPRFPPISCIGHAGLCDIGRPPPVRPARAKRQPPAQDSGTANAIASHAAAINTGAGRS